MSYKKDEIFNSLSMIPGIGLSLWWIIKTKCKLYYFSFKQNK